MRLIISARTFGSAHDNDAELGGGMHLEDGMKYLSMTASGRQWIANLHHHIAAADGAAGLNRRWTIIKAEKPRVASSPVAE